MNDLRIARITPRDAKGLSDHVLNLRAVVCQRESLYPGIDRWFDKKVISGLAAQDRIAYLGYINEQPAIAAIVRLGEKAKVCHINIREDLQEVGLGEIFFSLLALEARSHAKALHLTLPESLWASKMGFFREFGLDTPTIANKQYRLFDEELALARDFPTIWQSVLKKIPKLAHRFSLAGNVLSDGVLLSVQPEFAEKIMRGTKTVEIRRRFSRIWLGQRAVFYASAPLQALMGQADIGAIHVAAPDRIWTRFGTKIGCEETYFRKYVAGCSKVFAIELANINPYIEPVFSAAITTYTQE
jgi:predicted transcriptional regulator